MSVDLTVADGSGIRRVSGARVSASRMMAIPRGARRGRGGFPPAGILPPGARGTSSPGPPAGTASIAGRVTAGGASVAGVAVSALTWRTNAEGGSRPFRSGEPARTNDDGAFRVTGLRAGDYGVVAFVDGMGVAGIRSVNVPRSTLPQPARAQDGTMLAYANTFYPGSTTPSAAAVITVADGEAKGGVELDMRRAPAANVGGRLLTPSGAPIRASAVALRPVDPVDQIGGSGVRYGAVSADGSFQFEGVGLGEYDLVLVGSMTAWGDARITVGEEPVDDLTLRLDPPVTLSGRVEFRGAGDVPASDAGITVTVVSLPLQAGARRTPVRVSPDGTFTASVAPGQSYRLDVEAPLPWAQVFGLIDGQDTLDGPVLLAADTTDALVVLTDRDTSLSGAVEDLSGAPLLEGRLVIFPVDRGLRRSGSRRVRLIRLVGDGLFTATDLPPGEYYVVAGADLAPTGRIDNARLAQIEDGATRITLALGQQRRVTIVAR
jgi:hypothetical protein